MTRLLWIAFPVFLLLACSPETPKGSTIVSKSSSVSIPERPKVDLTTPDRALKSYWQQREWARGVDEHLDIEFKKAHANRPEYATVIASVATGDVLADAKRTLSPRARYERDIDSIKQETDSRAVALVRIRNTTVVPEGAKATAREFRRRETGTMFRYVLEKEGADWKVAEVWRNDDILGPRKLYSDRQPLYPSEVYFEE